MGGFLHHAFFDIVWNIGVDIFLNEKKVYKYFYTLDYVKQLTQYYDWRIIVNCDCVNIIIIIYLIIRAVWESVLTDAKNILLMI